MLDPLSCTSSTRILTPHFLNEMASHDVSSNICQALGDGAASRRSAWHPCAPRCGPHHLHSGHHVPGRAFSFNRDAVIH